MFITVEGPDGAGKTTLARGLAEALGAQERDVLLVREPGGTHLGEALRALLLDPRSQIDVRAEALLYAAARAQLVADVIRPSLRGGRLVVCDRYVESSLAYQGAGRGLGVEAVRAMNDFATGGLRADLVVLLDLDPSVAAQRQAGGEPDRLEAAGLHDAVRRCYLDLAAAEPERFVVVDASQAPGKVLARALEAVLG